MRKKGSNDSEDVFEKERGDSDNEKKIHVFIDNSNIFLGAQNLGGRYNSSTRLNYHTLANLLEKGRNAQTRVLCVSTPPGSEKIWNVAKDAGYYVHRLKKVDGKEQAVDECLHSKILLTILTYEPAKNQILVLATGDGNDNGGYPNTSFPRCVQAALNKGWKVELYCWSHTKNAVWDTIKKQSNGGLTIINLDSYCKEITFDEKKRR